MSNLLEGTIFISYTADTEKQATSMTEKRQANSLENVYKHILDHSPDEFLSYSTSNNLCPCFPEETTTLYNKSQNSARGEACFLSEYDPTLFACCSNQPVISHAYQKASILVIDQQLPATCSTTEKGSNETMVTSPLPVDAASTVRSRRPSMKPCKSGTRGQKSTVRCKRCPITVLKKNYKDHQKIHDENRTREFSCFLCHRKYFYKRDLYRHLRGFCILADYNMPANNFLWKF